MSKEELEFTINAFRAFTAGKKYKTIYAILYYRMNAV